MLAWRRTAWSAFRTWVVSAAGCFGWSARTCARAGFGQVRMEGPLVCPGPGRSLWLSTGDDGAEIKGRRLRALSIGGAARFRVIVVTELRW